MEPDKEYRAGMVKRPRARRGSPGHVRRAAHGPRSVNVRARTAATWLGLLLMLLTALIYAPILATAVQSSEMIEGMNYVADTLLFAGTVLPLAEAP